MGGINYKIMDVTTPFLTVTQLALVPLVMAVVSVLKLVNWTGLNNRLAPIFALVLGIASAFLIPSETLQLTIIAGVTIGCIAAGVYSGIKTTVQG